ncbi:hypothetical protein SeMB42_g06367, partial [Synchytrium endobioticum]
MENLLFSNFQNFVYKGHCIVSKPQILTVSLSLRQSSQQLLQPPLHCVVFGYHRDSDVLSQTTILDLEWSMDNVRMSKIPKASIALYRLSSRLSFSTHLALSRTYCPSPKPTEISFDFQLICPLQANSHLDIMPLVQISRNSAKSNSIGPSAKDPTTTAADAASPKLHTESAHRTVDSSNGLPAQAPAPAPRHDAATSPTAPSPTLASPDVVSSCLKPHKYELTEFNVDRTLGTGSFGRVHMVKLNTTGKYYAMKVLRKVDVVRMKQVEHTVSEKTILEQLDFPFLVSLLGTFQDCQNLYMVMEYVQGGELFSYLRRCGRFPNNVARFYAAEVVCAF